MTRSRHISILGAGQCGTLLATMLAQENFSVSLYERNGDPRNASTAAGRSINLALAARGINALRKAGVLARVEPLLVPMRGRMVHAIDGSTELLPYGQRADEQIYSASRGELNKILLDAAEEHKNVEIRFSQGAQGYDVTSGNANMRDLETAHDYEIDVRPIIAADGAGSVVRNSLHAAGIVTATESLLPHGYKELAIPAGPDGTFQLDPHALHIWPRGGFMLIALPNPGGDFTLTIFLANKGDTSFEALSDEQTAGNFFETNFPDAARLIPDFAHALVNSPLGLLGTVRCSHWHDKGKALLIGDAAHAVVPFHGQGMNLAFEDCVVLDRIIRTSRADWSGVFRQFENEQRANANAIADMALENYVEMRDTVRDPKFVLRNALAFELERRRPERFIPRYSMVMFHADIPYRVAQQRGALQNALLEEFTQDADQLEDVDLDAATAAAVERLTPIETVRDATIAI
ncbi:MAG: FAD-dependent monooxygenase [Gammaproteobacteria bacterium]|nr:FAD-dependent monooxygenase [Gammaproteobacteria bacterium]